VTKTVKRGIEFGRVGIGGVNGRETLAQLLGKLQKIPHPWNFKKSPKLVSAGLPEDRNYGQKSRYGAERSSLLTVKSMDFKRN